MRDALALIVLLTSCARIEPPPGGPPDNAPPRLVTVRPESMAVYADFHGPVEFRFDEVISEGSQASQGLGTSELERLYRDVRCGGFHPANTMLVHEIVGKTTLGIGLDEQPRWG